MDPRKYYLLPVGSGASIVYKQPGVQNPDGSVQLGQWSNNTEALKPIDHDPGVTDDPIKALLNKVRIFEEPKTGKKLVAAVEVVAAVMGLDWKDEQQFTVVNNTWSTIIELDEQNYNFNMDDAYERVYFLEGIFHNTTLINYREMVMTIEKITSCKESVIVRSKSFSIAIQAGDQRLHPLIEKNAQCQSVLAVMARDFLKNHVLYDMDVIRYCSKMEEYERTEENRMMLWVDAGEESLHETLNKNARKYDFMKTSFRKFLLQETDQFPKKSTSSY